MLIVLCYLLPDRLIKLDEIYYRASPIAPSSVIVWKFFELREALPVLRGLVIVCGSSSVESFCCRIVGREFRG
jgi:hypothetical protein